MMAHTQRMTHEDGGEWCRQHELGHGVTMMMMMMMPEAVEVWTRSGSDMWLCE